MGIALDVPWLLITKIIDKEGRYVILIGKIDNQDIILVGVYAPNKLQVPFWEELFSHLPQYCQYRILMMEDFNAVLDEMDRSFKTSTPGITMVFLQNMKQFQLRDV